MSSVTCWTCIKTTALPDRPSVEDALALTMLVRTSQDVAAVCGISAMPTFQVWQEGQKKDELVGASKEKLMAIVNAHTHDAKETTTNPATSAPKATGTAPPLTMPSGAAC